MLITRAEAILTIFSTFFFACAITGEAPIARRAFGRIIHDHIVGNVMPQPALENESIQLTCSDSLCCYLHFFQFLIFILCQ